MENFLVTMRDLFVGVLLGVYEDGKGERERKKKKKDRAARQSDFVLISRPESSGILCASARR